MKKILYIILALIFTVSVQAQVDRSKQPQPGPAPKINLTKPQSFTLPNGLTVMVVENHKLPRVTFSLTLDNPPSVEGNIKGVDEVTSSMMGNGTSKLSKDDFNEKLDYYGASVWFSVHNVGGNTLSKYFPDVLALVAQGALDPLFVQDDLDSEKAKLIDGIKTSEKSTQAIASRVKNILTYGKNHPAGEFLLEENINRISMADVNNYYKTFFVPGNAYLVVVGDVKFDDVKKLVTDSFSSWKKASAPKSTYTEPTNLAKAEINLIDVPHAVQSEIYVGNVVDLKMTDPDYYAALLANQVLGGGADGRLFLNLREAHGWTYGSYSSIRGDKYISDFSASASVRNAVTDSAVVEMLNEVKRVRTTLPTQADLDLVKAKYVGNFVMNAEKPQTIASFALREKTQSLPANYYETYIQNINNVTLEQVQAAAKKYILNDETRIVVAGKASEVLAGLEKLNIPIKYYDKYGNPTAKPEAKAVDSSITAQSILQKYIDAIGGKEAIEKLKTVMITTKASMQGVEITTVSKQTADGKTLIEMSAMGMVMSKIVFDGKNGYAVQQGTKKDLTAEELESVKDGMIPELKMLNAIDIQVAGIEKIGDSDAYKLVQGKKTYFYNVATGLKTGMTSSSDMGGQMITQNVTISDYRNVGNIKMPYKQTISMPEVGVEMNSEVSDIKVNEGVSDSDFK